jgi:hypothetical protein
MKSFSILRTNVGLTTNVKVVCDSSYNLYLESFDSVPQLSIDRLKKVKFNKKNYYDELVPYFFRDFPSDLAFSIYYSNDNNNMSNDFTNQYDDLYQMGARNIVNNKNYTEEYEYLAPLYVFKESIPKYFVIFRIDGPGLEDLDSTNFVTNFIQKFKCVKLFDLTMNSNLGEWIYNNFTNNRSFPASPLEVDFRNLEFSRWYGIDYLTGGYTFKSLFLDSSLENENTLFDFEKLFFDGYKSSKTIFPNIINFSFLFDDTPATPTSLRKWSINRYSGFYLENLEVIHQFTPFIMPKLKSDVEVLEGNILSSATGDPFELGYSEETPMWVEYQGDFYKVEKFTEEIAVKTLTVVESKNPVKRLLQEKFQKNRINNKFTQETLKDEQFKSSTSISKYRILSEIDLEGKQSLLNINSGYINTDKQIVDINGLTYSISDLNLADVHLVEIDGSYHNLIIENGAMKLHTDYGFRYTKDFSFEYYVAEPDPRYLKTVNLLMPRNTKPFSFKIWRAKFSEIKDFDTQLIDNEFSKYEYEQSDSLTDTEESKMYTTDLRSLSNPATLNDYVYKDSVVNIPCSSDYTANLETFRIVDNNLSDIWRKNSVHCRFGFQNSISHFDYPYLLNNNDIHERFNKSCDSNAALPLRSSRNLDYFYTINSGTTSYINQSLHVERNISPTVQDTNFKFELDKYLGVATYSTSTQSATYSFDYFSYFFGGYQYLFRSQIIKSVEKYSYFNSGDSAIPNTTVFRGLKFKIYEVDSITKNDTQIENINVSTSNLFNDYKFSILLSENQYNVDNDGTLYKPFVWNNFDQITHRDGYMSFIENDSSATSSTWQVGDLIQVKQNYPERKDDLDGTFQINYVGFLTQSVVLAVTQSYYGFSVNKSLTQSFTYSGYYSNIFKWKTIKDWKLNTSYVVGDSVLYEDVLYDVLVANTIDNPEDDPSTLTSLYSISSLSIPFWNPQSNYGVGDWCYRQGEFYYKASDTGIDFWHTTQPFDPGTIVSWNNSFYKLEKLTTSVKEKPEEKYQKFDISSAPANWRRIPEPRAWYAHDEIFSDDTNLYDQDGNPIEKWQKVQVWDENTIFNTDIYVSYERTLYKYTSNSNFGITPDLDSSAIKIYSFEPDTNFIYTSSANPIILIGNTYYKCEYNRLNTLDSGINVFINKKHKNIFVNIFVNDKTTENLQNVIRDELYINTNSRLTALNFINQLNDLDSQYEFSDYTSYIIIEEDGTINKHSFTSNLDTLPYILVCEEADQFELKNNTLTYTSKTLSANEIKPLRTLIDGKINTLNELNFYNEIPLGCEIQRNIKDVGFGINYGGRKDITISNDPSVFAKSNSNVSETFFRHSGYYMPIFYKIELFKPQQEYDTLVGNYKFDTTLTFFGIMKQRIISKVNRKGTVLKLKNNQNLPSIYPMLDEFGYVVSDFFIFKSTWDFTYHIECLTPVNTVAFTNPQTQPVNLLQSQGLVNQNKSALNNQSK